MTGKHLLVAALAAVSCAAGAQSLKPGLWQITQRTQGGSGDMAQAMAKAQKQMASMSPEQRKAMQDMMARQGVQMGSAGPGGAMTIKMCMTPEMVQHDRVPAQRGDCQSTAQARSGNTIKTAFSCSNPPSKGEGQVTLISPEAYTSKMNVTTTVQGKPQQVAMESSGKWLSADCGSVKPPVLPKK